MWTTPRSSRVMPGSSVPPLGREIHCAAPDIRTIGKQHVLQRGHQDIGAHDAREPAVHLQGKRHGHGDLVGTEATDEWPPDATRSMRIFKSEVKELQGKVADEECAAQPRNDR